MHKPEFFVNSIFDLNFNYLKKVGYKYLLIDMDNTIIPYGYNYVDNKTKILIKNLKNKGFCLCLVSNAKKNRVQKIAESIKIPYIYLANKPFSKCVHNAIEKINGNRKESLLIGDQFCTDVLAAKRAEIHCILVEPLTKKDFFITKIYRIIEWFCKRKLIKEDMSNEE